ncbi:DUF6361 family protein [Brevibacterium yomogidense]
MMEIVDQFRDSTTVDDLGLGGIRDAFSDTLFPGTSTLHTRIRYALFVPWTMQLASERNATVSEMSAAFTRSEFQLTQSLLNGGEAEGVIGRVAGSDLKRTASTVYWGMLSTWGVFERGFTVREYFERCLLRREQRRVLPRADDPEAALDLTPTGLHEGLPAAPPDFLSAADFTLRPEDAQFLREAITHRAPGSFLAHLVENQPTSWTDLNSAPDSFASPEIAVDLPPDLRGLVTRAKKYAIAVHGASLVYNLVLARRTGRYIDDETTYEGHYIDWIREWFDEAQAEGTPTAEEQNQIWLMVTATGRALSRSTMTFVRDWIASVDAATTADQLIKSADVNQRIVSREREKKGARARLAAGNRRALDAWSGAAGTGRNNFRWNYVVQHLQDLYDVRGTD